MGITGIIEKIFGTYSDKEIKRIIDDVGKLTSLLASSSSRIEGTLANLEDVSGTMADSDLRGTLDTLGMAVSGLNEVIAKLNSEQGSAGMLLHDDQLYQSLTEASRNLSVLLEDINKNPRRYVRFSIFGGKKDK